MMKESYERSESKNVQSNNVLLSSSSFFNFYKVSVSNVSADEERRCCNFERKSSVSDGQMFVNEIISSRLSENFEYEFEM